MSVPHDPPELEQLLERYSDFINYVHSEVHDIDDPTERGHIEFFALGFLAGVATTVGDPVGKNSFHDLAEEGRAIVDGYQMRKTAESGMN